MSDLTEFDFSGLRVALVHDWITGFGGREQVLRTLCELFPSADLHVLFYLPDRIPAFVDLNRLRSSFLQKMPGLSKNYNYYLPLMPLAAERLDLQAYDLVISSSHCTAKGVHVKPWTKHICYCHSPMRVCWQENAEQTARQAWPIWGKPAAGAVLRYLRHWDIKANNGVHRFVANSSAVRRRIERFYGRQAAVIHPPVDCDRFAISPHLGDFYLIVGQLMAYKRIDLAVEACRRANRRLIIIGEGPAGRRLRADSIHGVDFLGHQPDEVVADYLSRCRAFLMPGEEDFGITAVEAQAAGRPVIALARGGVLDSVKALGQSDEPTGVLFDQDNAATMANAIAAFEHNTQVFDPEKTRRHALNFDRSVFVKRFADLVCRTIHE